MKMLGIISFCASFVMLGMVGMALVHAQVPHGTMYEETPLGVIDGINQTFTIQHQPLPWGAIKLYRNGLRMKRLAPDPVSKALVGDYSLDTTVFSSTKIVFQSACNPTCIPRPGDTLLADYTY